MQLSHDLGGEPARSKMRGLPLMKLGYSGILVKPNFVGVGSDFGVDLVGLFNELLVERVVVQGVEVHVSAKMS